MKAYLALISAAALALSACGDNKPAETPAAPPAASAEAAPASAASEAEPAAPAASEAAPAASAEAPAAAAGACETVVESNDMMNFNTKELVIDKTNCKEFKVTLKHTGKMPKTAMGHNIVISKAEDTQAVIKDGAGAGADGDYVKAGDERVIGHTKLIGGGEETTLKLDTSKLSRQARRCYAQHR